MTVEEKDCERLVDGICQLGYQVCAVTNYHPNCRDRKTEQPESITAEEKLKERVASDEEVEQAIDRVIKENLEAFRKLAKT